MGYIEKMMKKAQKKNEKEKRKEEKRTQKLNNSKKENKGLFSIFKKNKDVENDSKTANDMIRDALNSYEEEEKKQSEELREKLNKESEFRARLQDLNNNPVEQELNQMAADYAKQLEAEYKKRNARKENDVER